jgi:hypothetical protein
MCSHRSEGRRVSRSGGDTRPSKFAYVLEAVIWLSSDLKDDEAVAQLVRDGCPVARAWKLVAIVPMAFARVVFQPVGVSFDDHYAVLKPGVACAAHRKLTLDPIYRRALTYAQRLAASRRVTALFQILSRGADYAAILELHRQGVPLRDICLTTSGLVLEE